MYTIEDLKEGRVAVINDGTLEELKEVLSKAFPKDSTPPGGHRNYYFLRFKEFWGYDDTTDLPIQSVKDFLWQPKYGEKVEASNTPSMWERVTYIGKHTIFDKHITVGDEGHVWTFKFIRPIRTVELTLQEIADKFGVSVENLKIKGCDK